jgi:hypothetical protein
VTPETQDRANGDGAAKRLQIVIADDEIADSQIASAIQPPVPRRMIARVKPTLRVIDGGRA